jgi:hypothetical protein
LLFTKTFFIITQKTGTPHPIIVTPNNAAQILVRRWTYLQVINKIKTSRSSIKSTFEEAKRIRRFDPTLSKDIAPIIPKDRYNKLAIDVALHIVLLTDTESFFSFSHDGTVILNA